MRHLGEEGISRNVDWSVVSCSSEIEEKMRVKYWVWGQELKPNLNERIKHNGRIFINYIMANS